MTSYPTLGSPDTCLAGGHSVLLPTELRKHSFGHETPKESWFLHLQRATKMIEGMEHLLYKERL